MIREVRCDSSIGRHQCQGRKVGRPKGKGRPRLGSKIKGCCRPERDSMTANHVDHGIATFSGEGGDFTRPAVAAQRRWRAQLEWTRTLWLLCEHLFVGALSDAGGVMRELRAGCFLVTGPLP